MGVSMKTIALGKLGHELIEIINDDDPVDEDIGILDESGNLISVIIKKDAYDYFLKKVEEDEDREDLKSVKEFHDSGEKDK